MSATAPAPQGRGSLAGGTPQDPRAARLRWHCRRGMKELDVLLERFACQALPGASEDQIRAFAELLALPDPELAQYLLGEDTPPQPALAPLVAHIRALCRLGDG
jgi:antitoxin CptB